MKSKLIICVYLIPGADVNLNTGLMTLLSMLNSNISVKFVRTTQEFKTFVSLTNHTNLLNYPINLTYEEALQNVSVLKHVKSYIDEKCFSCFKTKNRF